MPQRDYAYDVEHRYDVAAKALRDGERAETDAKVTSVVRTLRGFFEGPDGPPGQRLLAAADVWISLCEAEAAPGTDCGYVFDGNGLTLRWGAAGIGAAYMSEESRKAEEGSKPTTVEDLAERLVELNIGPESVIEKIRQRLDSITMTALRR